VILWTLVREGWSVCKGEHLSVCYEASIIAGAFFDSHLQSLNGHLLKSVYCQKFSTMDNCPQLYLQVWTCPNIWSGITYHCHTCSPIMTPNLVQPPVLVACHILTPGSGVSPPWFGDSASINMDELTLLCHSERIQFLPHKIAVTGWFYMGSQPEIACMPMWLLVLWVVCFLVQPTSSMLMQLEISNSIKLAAKNKIANSSLLDGMINIPSALP
jgi:hypothetical protein